MPRTARPRPLRLPDRRNKLLALAIAAVPLSLSSTALADYYWINGATASTWSNGSDWNTSSPSGSGGAGAPASNSNVRIQNTDSSTHTITLDVPPPTLTLLAIGDTGSGLDTLLQTISNCNITAGFESVGSPTSTGGGGKHVQSADTNTFYSYLSVGDDGGSKGEYDLYGSGIVDVTGSGGGQLGLFVGYDGNGTFNQSNGAATISTPIYIGYDSIGTGTYLLSGGVLNCTAAAYVGDSGNGSFTQSAGTGTIGTSSANQNLYLGYNANANGTLSLSNTASLTVNGNAYIGGTSTAAGGNGTINITGGSINVTGTLKNYSTGAINLNGGVLTAQTVDISSGVFSAGGGTLIVSGGQFILPAAGKTFGDGSTSSTLILQNGTVTNGPLTIANHSTLAAAVASVPGRITASTNVNLQSGSILSLDLGAPTTAGTTFDQINQTSGTFFTGGATLSLTPIAGVVTGTTYPIVVTNGGSINYTTPFSNLSGSGTTYTYTKGSTQANVTYVGSSSAGTAIDVTFTALPFLPNTAAAWGLGSSGQLGNGNTNKSSSPVYPTGMNGGVTAVAAGAFHSLAIQNGGLYAWGSNGAGELGNGSTASSTTPVAVRGLSSGVTAVAAGESHSLAIQNGALYAWGDNGFGQLGTTQGNGTIPEPVSGLSSGVTAIAAGAYHSLAIQNGGLYAWGYNGFGQLGTTQGNGTIPEPVSGLSSGVTAVAAGNFHSLAIQNGGLYAWGGNNYGQLGNGNTTQQNTPVNIFPQGSGVAAVAAGGDFTLAVKGGKVYAWGDNTDGQLGSGTTIYSDTPTLVDPNQLTGLQLTSIIAVAAGYDSSYALSSDGSLWVWGSNGAGELGLGSSTTFFDLPQHLLPPAGETYTTIDADAGGYHAIAILAPEPSSLSLLALGGVMLLRRRRRRDVALVLNA